MWPKKTPSVLKKEALVIQDTQGLIYLNLISQLQQPGLVLHWFLIWIHKVMNIPHLLFWEAAPVQLCWRCLCLVSVPSLPQTCPAAPPSAGLFPGSAKPERNGTI